MTDKKLGRKPKYTDRTRQMNFRVPKEYYEQIRIKIKEILRGFEKPE